VPNSQKGYNRCVQQHIDSKSKGLEAELTQGVRNSIPLLKQNLAAALFRPQSNSIAPYAFGLLPLLSVSIFYLLM
jgi:hypothetical protein